MGHALVVLSGGMDSTTALHVALQEHEYVTAVGFNYGQRHGKELSCGFNTTEKFGLIYEVLQMPKWAMGASALTPGQDGMDVPEGHYAQETMKQTVVPNRNSIMLNVAAGYAMSIGADYVYTGVHSGDHPIYPDCRPEFISALNYLLGVANEGHNPPVVLAPFMHMEKSDIAYIGEELGVDWSNTWSCYKGGTIHCGRCSTCVERIEAFHNARVDDPTEYEDHSYWQEVVDAAPRS